MVESSLRAILQCVANAPSPVATGHLLQSDWSKCPAATGDGAFATHCRMALKISRVERHFVLIASISAVDRINLKKKINIVSAL